MATLPTHPLTVTIGAPLWHGIRALFEQHAWRLLDDPRLPS